MARYNSFIQTEFILVNATDTTHVSQRIQEIQYPNFRYFSKIHISNNFPSGKTTIKLNYYNMIYYFLIFRLFIKVT